jgi:molybdate transport system ATP-binding protein
MDLPIRHGPALFALEDVALRDGYRLVFRRSRWVWRPGEQWAILGPNGGGQRLLLEALMGARPAAKGEIHHGFGKLAPETAIVWLGPDAQRGMTAAEGSFYQSRWHSGVTESDRTVAEFLSAASVEQRNRFEVGAPCGENRAFQRRRSELVRRLDIAQLRRRRLLCLSNGEQRKVLLVHALLRDPRLLVLEQPFDGLDAATRRRMHAIIDDLMRGGLPVLVATHRPDEIPSGATHVLLVAQDHIVAQGAKSTMRRHSLARRLATAANSPGTLVTASKPPRRKVGRRCSREIPLIELKQVNVEAAGRRILEAITWTVRRGERWVLLGPNGSGKTTLLSLIQGDHPRAYALDVRLFGAPMHSTNRVWQARQRIGCFSPELHLHYPADWSCLDVVSSGFFNSIGLFQPCPPRQRAAARGGLDSLGLGDHATDAFGELSFGDQRLVLLARALVKQPELLVLDEPCQGLDSGRRRTVLATVDSHVTRTGAGLIFVTHHADERPQCITHQLRMRGGRVVETARLAG